MSRLDKLLSYEELVVKWKVEGQMVGDFFFFNHCPIWIKGNSNKWGQSLLSFLIVGFNTRSFFLLFRMFGKFWM